MISTVFKKKKKYHRNYTKLNNAIGETDKRTNKDFYGICRLKKSFWQHKLKNVDIDIKNRNFAYTLLFNKCT